MSDLDTIMETDQESNYMTTARTNALPSMAPSEHEKSEVKEIEVKEIPVNRGPSNVNETWNQTMMNQTINSLNDTSFMLTDNNALPATLFGGESQKTSPEK